MDDDLSVLGYTDKLSVRAGECLRVMVSCQADRFTADQVRLVGPGAEGSVPEQPLSSLGEHEGHVQKTVLGSWVEIDSHPALAVQSLTFQAWICPTVPGDGNAQVVLASGDRGGGWGLDVDIDGEPSFWLASDGCLAAARSRKRLIPRRWYFVACRYCARRQTAELYLEPADQPLAGPRASTRVDAPLVPVGRALTFAGPPGAGASAPAACSFNGKLERPSLWRAALEDTDVVALADGIAPHTVRPNDLVGSWDLGAAPHSTAIVDEGPHGLHGRAVNAPTRAVPGRAWDGSVADYRLGPDQYGAIHFHADDLEDAAWRPSLEVSIPPGAPGGVHAIRLTADRAIDHVPFVVRPARSRRALAVVLPTMTYMAYANLRYDQRLTALLEEVAGTPIRLGRHERYIESHPELGLSLYNHHADGSLTCLSSRLRPILEMRPDYRFCMSGAARHFSADLYLIGWLERTGRSYDVLTDEDLHLEGADALLGYRVVLTGSHPEYCTLEMLRAFEQYTSAGGRLMYLGGNGFYSVTSVAPGRSHLIEVRRGHAGTRPGDSEPGAQHHSADGQLGGLWRHRGLPSHALVGVGTAAQGGVDGAPYVRTPASYDPGVAFVFEGLEHKHEVGTGGPLGGAAGDEIDRADPRLGTPPNAIVLATSRGRHSDRYQVAVEDLYETMPGMGGTTDERVRADMTYVEHEGQGAVFAVGSIAWSLSLAPDSDADIARLTDNVVRAFSSDDGLAARRGPTADGLTDPSE